ncbi:MAG: aminoacyl-tRNA hydrolase, partial [Paracoccaceae bacterium]|nr:aminoacyl-tRNA hydrolase [Paracoccaceae bacterium]
AHIGADYGRVRLGIGHPGHKDAVANYVLHDFAKADADWLAALLVGLSDGAPALASGDSEKFMTLVARQTHPPRSGTGVGGSEGERAKDAPCPRPAAASPTAKLEVAPAQTALQVLLQKFRS